MANWSETSSGPAAASAISTTTSATGRKPSEFGSTTDYETDELNQYTAIERGEESVFEPVHDADGNQTLVKTSTGIWTVTYNAENRPVNVKARTAGQPWNAPTTPWAGGLRKK
ncbi:hypothetical protein M5E88_10260 [Akkermansia muciniphila]|nr:hypothetical protein M5E88_10260 [Akkermansia muciniphila]